jgi:APA family basic amino acid/polyamine antiporter
MSEDGKLQRGISLPMAVFIVVGVVIGSSIWLLPTQALAEAGPGMFLGYLLAMIPGLFMALICAYLGATVPTAGGSYVVISRMLGPLAGALTLSLVIVGAGGALAFMAGTFGIFLNSATGAAIPLFVSGAGILLLAYLVNILRVQVSATVQMVITLLGDMLVIAIFILFALPHVDAANLKPLFPKGFGPVVQASLLFFFSYAGFTAVLDIGGEIKDPKRNIPRALAISLAILVGMYTLQAFMVAGTTPWTLAAERIAAEGSFTVADLAAPFIPAPILAIMPVLILVAVASTIHPLLLAYSRDFLMAGRDQLMPAAVARITPRYGSPIGGLSVLLGFSLVLFGLILSLGPALELPVQIVVDLFAAISVSGVLGFEILLAIAALRVAQKYPEMEAQSGLRLSRPLLWVVAVGGVLSSVVFLALLAMEEALIIEVMVALAVPFLIYYGIRRWQLARRGVQLRGIIDHWPEGVMAD